MHNRLSAEAEELLAYAFERGGRSPVVHDEHVVHEAIRDGLIELVTIGADEPTVVLTPAGMRRCQPSAPLAAFPSPKIARAPG